MTESLMSSREFPIATGYSTRMREAYASCVDEGIRQGVILGKRLQTRSESRDTIYNRQSVGRLDKRMVSSLGYGNEHVFFTKETDKYKKANLHVSVDASGSMTGKKFEKTLTSVVALCKAVDMISNLEIQVTFRTTNGSNPYVVVAYDSRVDKFTKVKTLFRYLHPNNTTPEGLCYEAIMKNMVGISKDVDSYFLNFSDGEPYFDASGFTYNGEAAAKHTKSMVDMMEAMGIKVLSYFISDGDYNRNSYETFKKSYGKAASFVNVSNINDVIKTVNGLFMAK